MFTGIRNGLLSVVLILTLMSGAAWGDVIIFDNGWMNWSSAAISDLDPDDLLGGGYAVCADDFTLAAGSNVITDVHWSGYHYAAPITAVDDFTIVFYEQSLAVAHVPGDIVAQYNACVATRTDTGETVEGAPVYAYDFDLPSALTLAPDTLYFISIYNNTAGTPGYWAWTSAYGGTGDFAPFWMAFGGPPWSMGFFNLDFDLTGRGCEDGVVPEPATLSLMGLGLAGGALARLRRKNR